MVNYVGSHGLISVLLDVKAPVGGPMQVAITEPVIGEVNLSVQAISARDDLREDLIDRGVEANPIVVLA